MSSFAENIQFFRKRENMTQEQLAEKLEVSRQTVSKWEAGNSYPEMEKILQLCQVFSCNMDTLMREDASRLEAGEHQQYEKHMERRRRRITFGIVLLLLDTAVYELFTGLGAAESILNTMFMAVAIIAILVFVVEGIQHGNFRKKFTCIPEFYSQEILDKFNESFAVRIAAGVGMILIGLLVAMNGEALERAAGVGEDFFYGIFMVLAAVAAGIIVYAALGKEKYNIASYNRANEDSKENQEIDRKTGIWCGCIMLFATIVFLVAGLAFNLWNICWLAYPVGGILCGVVALIYSVGKK